MKLEDLAYAITQRVFEELERKHHFSVPDSIRQAVTESVQQHLDELMN
jgi:hypothetical protein